jgi:UDP-N-acetylglucosamine 2-epimerase
MHFFRNMPPEAFLRLLVRSNAIVGNSSVAIREGSFLGVPAVNIGDRQAGREHGPNVLHVGHERREIIRAVAEQMANDRYPGVPLYGDGESGKRIAEVLATCRLSIEKRLCY